jgi:hypothetical protein
MLEPDKELASFKKRETIVNILKVTKKNINFDPDVSRIEEFAKEFGLDPDYVYNEKDFDTVMMFSIKWKQLSEFNERYAEIDRMLSEKK